MGEEVTLRSKNAGKSMKRIALFISFCLLSLSAMLAQSLSGTVSLAGNDDNALATIRIEDLGIGTTSKLDGSYLFADIPVGTHVVEFSYVGYKPVRKTVTVVSGETTLLDVEMEEETITLSEVLITPDGTDPVQYILNKVWQHADQRYKAAGDFRINTETLVSYQDFDVLEAFLSKSMKSFILFAAGLAGYKTVVNMLFKYPNLDLTTTNSATCIKGKYKWNKEVVKRSNVDLTDKEKSAVDKVGLKEDLYKNVYVDNLLRKKNTVKTLKGSYTDGDKVIFVVEAKKGKSTETIHVEDLTWNVRKFVATMGDNMEVKCELRRAVGDLYMPVSVNATIVFVRQSPEQLMRDMQKDDNSASEKGKESMEKKVQKMLKDENQSKRLRQITERLKTKGLDCSLNLGLTVKYGKN